MNSIDYLIEELIKEDKRLNNIEIPSSENEKKELYWALRNIRDPKPLSPEYLKIQDKFLQEEIKEKSICIKEDCSKVISNLLK